MWLSVGEGILVNSRIIDAITLCIIMTTIHVQSCHVYMACVLFCWRILSLVLKYFVGFKVT